MPHSPDTSAEVRQAYNEWVRQYDTNENRTRDLNAKALRHYSFDLTGKSVLEVGCGTGLNTMWLADRAQLVVGMDIAEGMLQKATCRLNELSVHLLQADITKPWPFEQTFDLVVANLILEHVADLTQVFNEAHRVLRSGGLFHIGELHPYKQIQGVQAKYRDLGTGQEVLVPAFQHSVSEYVNNGIAIGFTLRHIGEWRHETDSDYRLLTLLFERK